MPFRIAHVRPPDFAEHLRSIVVGGALYPCGADLYGRESPQGTERWFATTLSSWATSRVLEARASTVDAWERFEALLRPDPLLGVTTVRITSRTPGCSEALHEAAVDAFPACLVEEVIAHSLLSSGHD